MKGRPSRSRKGEVSIGGALMVASRTIPSLQEVDIRTKNSTIPTREERDLGQEEEAENEEIEVEVVEDVEALPPTELLSKQHQTL